MFERFTARAREVVSAARDEATRLGHQYVGTEHLLLGLLTSSPGPAAPVLADAGLHPEDVRREVIRLVGTGCDALGAGEAAALQAIGINLDAVRSKLEDSFGEGVLDQPHGGRPGAHLPFTPRAKKSLGLALREAKRLGHNYVGTEHILLGLIQEANGIAGQILATKEPLRVLRERVLAEIDKAA
jgi:ATP-dependent Clp protease ATP-binding subunit ClpA